MNFYLFIYPIIPYDNYEIQILISRLCGTYCSNFFQIGIKDFYDTILKTFFSKLNIPINVFAKTFSSNNYSNKTDTSLLV